MTRLTQYRGRFAKQLAEYTAEFARHFRNRIAFNCGINRAAAVARKPVAIVSKSRVTRATVVVRKRLANRSATQLPPSSLCPSTHIRHKCNCTIHPVSSHEV